MKYSIIVPAYNSEKYIKRCLNSIILQNYNNLEVIVINDGSTDSTASILEEYNNDYIKTYYIKNSGVSNARNFGLEKAEGDFIIFMDADDFLADDFFNEVENINLENDSIYVFNYHKASNENNTKKVLSNKINEVYKIDAIKYCVKSSSNPYKNTRFNTVWGKIFGRSILSNIKFDKNISIGEDSIFFCEAAIASNKIIYVEKLMYYYFTNNNSATHSYNENMYNNDVCWHNKLVKVLNNIEFDNKDILTNYTILKGFLNNIILNIVNDSNLSFFDKKKKIKELKSRSLFKNIRIDSCIINEFNLKDKIILSMIKFKLFGIIVLYFSIKK